MDSIASAVALHTFIRKCYHNNSHEGASSLTISIPSTPNTHNTAYTGTKNLYNNRSPLCGAVAHLGERFNGIEEVRGSSPRSSTIIPVLCLIGSLVFVL